MKSLKLLILLILSLSGCARFSTTQTDTSYQIIEDERTKTAKAIPLRTITTKVTASTYFTSKSELARFKASQTDKTQGASVGELSLESSGTNALKALSELRMIIQALPK